MEGKPEWMKKKLKDMTVEEFFNLVFYKNGSLKEDILNKVFFYAEYASSGYGDYKKWMEGTNADILEEDIDPSNMDEYGFMPEASLKLAYVELKDGTVYILKDTYYNTDYDGYYEIYKHRNEALHDYEAEVWLHHEEFPDDDDYRHYQMSIPEEVRKEFEVEGEEYSEEKISKVKEWIEKKKERLDEDIGWWRL